MGCGKLKGFFTLVHEGMEEMTGLGKGVRKKDFIGKGCKSGFGKERFLVQARRNRNIDRKNGITYLPIV